MPVVLSVHDDDGQRCVDIIEQAAGAFCFKEVREDPEDRGRWYVVHDFSSQTYPSKEAALHAASHAVDWLGDVLARRG